MTTSESFSVRDADASHRRVGYSVSIAVNAVLLGGAVLGWPGGWEAVPFLTDDFSRVSAGWSLR